MLVPVNFSTVGIAKNIHWLDETTAFIKRARKQKKSGAALAGLKYENEVNDAFTKRYPDRYLIGPWIEFYADDETRIRVAQPDGIIFDLSRGSLTIIEIKLRHTIRSWWQLRHLYEPIIKAAFPGWIISVCEVIKYYDSNC